MFCPKMIGTVDENVKIPVVEIACKIPTVAAELWTIAVTKAPAKTPKIGLDNLWSIVPNIGNSPISFTDYIGQKTEFILLAWYAMAHNILNDKIGFKEVTIFTKKFILFFIT